MTITEKIDYMLARLKETDAKCHDLEHDLPHIHAAGREDGPSQRVHGAAGTWETSELRDEIARLADIVRELATDLGYAKAQTVAEARLYDAGDGSRVTIPENDR